MRATFLTIFLLIATLCIYSKAKITEIKSETEFEAKLRSNNDIFLFFVDDERERESILNFWEDQQAKFDKQEPTAQAYFVNVNNAISLQRKFRVDRRGDAILFQRGKESIRASWSVPERMERWVSIIREPQSFDVMITFEEFETLSQETSFLVSFNDNLLSRQIGILNERPNNNNNIAYREINKEDYEKFFNKYPTPSERNQNAKKLFLFKNHATNLFFYKELNEELGTIVDDSIQISKWIDLSLVKGLKSILESSQENFQKHAETYQYVVVVPYPIDKKEEYLHIIYEVEEKEENSHFGFLYVESSNALMPFPISFEIERNPNPNKELRIMWNPDEEFNLETFANWIEKIRTNTHEPFTTIKVPDIKTNKYFDISPPVTPLTFQELQDLHKNAKEFNAIFCHSVDKNSASAYYLLEEIIPSLDLNFYSYNVLTNTYRGPPTPVLLIMKGNLETYLPMKSVRDATIMKNAILSELRKLDHKEDL